MSFGCFMAVHEDSSTMAEKTAAGRKSFRMKATDRLSLNQESA
jgi:hypothetical protein